ncbi:NAD(P)H-dependent oxidoreductase [soil metagenome]
MPTLLQLDSSAELEHSRSRAITAAFADAWRAIDDDHTVVVRDLHRDQLPHLASADLHWPERLRPEGADVPADAEALQAELIDELLGADVVVIGAPLYNYSMPSTLKAWIDNIHVPGFTAPFDLPVQPLAGRPVVIVSSRGASYDTGSPSEGWDHAVPPLTLILGGALGMTVSVITTSLTLAETVPALADQLDRSRAEFAAAKTEAERLARELG